MTEFFANVKTTIIGFFESVYYAFSTMTVGEMVVNILDILLMSLLIFAVYKFISKRRAGKLAVGMILVIALSLISSIAGMKGITFILSNFYQVGILAVIILFQPELRAALEKVGGNPLVTGIKNIAMESKDLSEVKSVTDELVDAVCDLSKTKTGAIIVLENSTKLGEYIQTGKIVDAAVSTELIKNIFYNGSPLHDGAVIVRGMRIYAASCFLPLAAHDKSISHLGSRHRAAVGISENSDALVLVVSEETGTISIAFQGELSRQYSRDKLHEVVQSFFTQQSIKPHLKNGKKGRKREANKEEVVAK